MSILPNPKPRVWMPYFLYLALLFLGATGVLLQQAWNREALHDAKVKKLEADVRTYSGKFLDLQEQGNDELDTVKGKLSMVEWQLEDAKKSLAICQAKPESRATLGHPKK